MTYNSAVKIPEVVWWSYVSGPSLFVRQTADALCGGKNVCLCVPDFIPWRDTFLEYVINGVREVEKSLLFETLHNTPKEPGEYLVEYFRLSASYRPTKSYADFLRERRAFSDRVLCVLCASGEEDDEARRWVEFEKDYKPSSVHDGIVLLETRAAPAGGVPAHMKVLVYDDFVSDYDMLVFAGLLFPDQNINMDHNINAEQNMNTEQKKYLAAMAVSLFGKDAESAAGFIGAFNYASDDPERYRADIPPESVARRVWNAQVQTLFPLIMRECREFIDRWYDRIEDAFNYAGQALPKGLVDTGNMPVESPDTMELATLRYLMCNKKRGPDGSETEDYMLYIPDDSARARLELLYRARNRIAHGKVCPAEEAAELLNPSALK